MVLRGLFVGRFQPPHKGHLEIIRKILNEVDELIIIIGSAQYNYTLRNPFTTGERIWMLREALREYDIDLSRIIIVPLNDIENNALWVRYVQTHTPPFSIVYTGNEFVAKLFKDMNVEVKMVDMIERDKYSGTRIRELMIKGSDEWKEFVPKSVVKIIEIIRGVERLKIVARTSL